ncbi:MAG: hypothetical protein IBJ15_13220 [Alphaproteobacteria bacterium]|nr:hypothetical protein [Alphaproteobacteria bacterium]
MGGETVYKALDEFSRQKCAFYLPMRNIKGSALEFSECFIDESDLDVMRILRILKTNASTDS